MIPKSMESFLLERLPERTWRNRLVRENGLCFMEFGPMDVDRLARLGIVLDNLGPKLVACLWDEESTLEIGGYLVVDNLAMGRPSMGGIRMLPDLTPADVYNLARGMTLKNAAANLPFGGGKAGILAEPDLDVETHNEIVRCFAHLIYRYRDIYLPGPDVGTHDADMKTIAIENGLDCAVSKPVDMGGNRIDQLGAAGGGLVIALEALLEEIPRLKALPQFVSMQLPSSKELTVMLQGFGAVGANAAYILCQRLPGARVIGVSDISGYLFDERGLPCDRLFQLWQAGGPVSLPYYRQELSQQRKPDTKFSTSPEDMLRETVFCFIPAAPIANYLDTDLGSGPSMTVDRMGQWRIIVEGANTYSPDPSSKAARARMERAVYRQRGVMIATDYLVNSGGVIFAAQEQLIKTPARLRIPEKLLGDRQAVEGWLVQHAAELHELADIRRKAAEAARDAVIRRNMHELVDLLVSDTDLLPCEAAESITIQRITSRERKRTAEDIMEMAITIPASSTLREAAILIVETGSPILAVVDQAGGLAGVVTDWDITRATAEGRPNDLALDQIMTTQVISAGPADPILELVRKLEYHEISAMPIVKDKIVVGIVSTDLLARRSLYPLLISQKT